MDVASFLLISAKVGNRPEMFLLESDQIPPSRIKQEVVIDQTIRVLRLIYQKYLYGRIRFSIPVPENGQICGCYYSALPKCLGDFPPFSR